MKDTLLQMLGGALVAIGGMFMGAGLNEEGSNNGLYLTIGIILTVIGAAEYIRQWRTGMFDYMSSRARVGMTLVMIAVVLVLALGGISSVATFIALGLAAIGLAIYFQERRRITDNRPSTQQLKES